MTISEQTSVAARTGFIGLGKMGRPMCHRLLASGAALALWNRNRSVTERWYTENQALRCSGDQPAPEIAATPADLARMSRVILINVTDGDALASVLTAPDGVLEGVKPGALVIDLGTSGQPVTLKLAARIEEAGGRYVDAPVSGGVTGAENGSLSFMMGGREADVEEARVVLSCLGARFTRCGPVGTGQVAKTANQAIVGLGIAAVAEALTLAQRAGVAPNILLSALQGGFAESRILQQHGPRMATGDFTPGGTVAIQHKDIRLGCELAESLGLDLPSLTRNLALWQQALDQGLSDLDHSGLYRLWNEK